MVARSSSVRRPRERRVLAHLSTPRRRVGKRGEHRVDGAVEHARPLVEPESGLAPSCRTHQGDVPMRPFERCDRVGHDVACRRVGEPQAPTVLAAEHFGSSVERFQVLTLDAPVRADRRVRQDASQAQVDHMLARAANQLGRLPGREQLIGGFGRARGHSNTVA